jgi:phosphoserine phosphatase
MKLKRNFSLAECAVVGDSSYDIPMFKKVGLSIAFNSDEKNVQKSADIVIENKDLQEILPFLLPISRHKPHRI